MEIDEKGTKGDNKWEKKSENTRIEKLSVENELDAKYGYFEPTEPGKYTGWLVNFHAGDTFNEDKKLVSCVHYYFLKQDGARFKNRER
jgi:hypothetical protein